MKEQELPYVAPCSFCNQGLLRFMRCRECDAVVAVCDQCELVWRDIAAVHRNPHCPSSGSYPACPACGHPQARWSRLTRRKVEQADLEPYIGGESL
ncbi:MAG: hypothetical protein GXY83_29140 [Rhodopirellula sp.]|nr:hypothetical protein [Rhodopirellula sp.]